MGFASTAANRVGGRLPSKSVETGVATCVWKPAQHTFAFTLIARTYADSDASTGMPVTAAVTPGLVQVSDAGVTIVGPGAPRHLPRRGVNQVSTRLRAANPLQQNLVMLPNRGYRRGYHRAGYLDCACAPWRLDGA